MDPIIEETITMNENTKARHSKVSSIFIDCIKSATKSKNNSITREKDSMDETIIIQPIADLKLHSN